MHDFEIAIVNRSEQLGNEEVWRAASSINRQLQRDFKPIWGGRNTWVEFDPEPEGRDWTLIIVDEPTVDGAAGWHSIDDRGHVVSEVAVNTGLPWTAIVSHEVLEMVANEAVNKVAQNYRDGMWYPLEVCDPVQSELYEIEGVWVSDFVLPEWFAMDLRAPKTAFKTMGLKPFQVAKGGYAIRWDDNDRDRTIYRSEIPGHVRNLYAPGPDRTEHCDV